jgi:sugar phosphate isomerase/epimerase
MCPQFSTAEGSGPPTIGKLIGMKPPNYEDIRVLPLQTDADIEHRVAELIGRANLRQLWLLFLDELNVQLPLLIPVDGLPTEPTTELTASVLARVDDLMGEIGAASVVLVWERYGAATLTAQDAAWARSLHEACDNARVPLRAMLLSHRTGVCFLAEHDYRQRMPTA